MCVRHSAEVDAVKTKIDKPRRYERPAVKRVLLDSPRPLLGTCKVENSDTRGMGPCGSGDTAVCKN